MGIDEKDDGSAPIPGTMPSPAFETEIIKRTAAAHRYFDELWTILRYFEHIQHQAADLDRLTCIVKHGRDCHREGGHPFMSPARANLDFAVGMLAEMSVARSVDNFLVYLVDVYGEMAQIEPRILVGEGNRAK
jgi:hypothetical protein